MQAFNREMIERNRSLARLLLSKEADKTLRVSDFDERERQIIHLPFFLYLPSNAFCSKAFVILRKDNGTIQTSNLHFHFREM